VSNQIIARDRYAEYIFMLANIATTLDKIGIEIRTLQRTEIGEVEEEFGEKQVGSSTMPHKRNPIKSEQIGGLSRIVRAMVEPALLNNTLWDERDLTNSSCERITFPEATILCDHCLNLMTNVLENLVIREKNVHRNLLMLHGINLAESVMIELTRRGMPRQNSHEIIRESSMQAIYQGRTLTEVLSANENIMKYVSVEELTNLLDPDAYIGLAEIQVDNLIRKLETNYTL
jgi:adenylosuccinate lyase